MELLLEVVQTVGVAYLVWRKYTSKAPDLRHMVRAALVDRVTQLGSGRERLRARLAAKGLK